MGSFNELGLSDKALAAVTRMGYDEPTPVQQKAIPLVLAGRDVIAAAQTGTGKTAAFTLPTMDTLPHAKGGSGPLMLVITPTRELAQQISEVADQIAVSTHHRITTVVGGLSYKPQIERLRRGTDILIATPGRLIDLMEQQAVRLADVSVLVLDEADRMLDMGFLPSVKKIVAATPKTRQTLLFSATIDKSIMKIVGSMLHNPETVEIARKGDVAQTVQHYIIRTPQSVKPALIKAVLAEKGAERVIVFARTRSRADSICRRLRKAGYAVEAIHSDRSQNQRRRALEKFSKGEVNIITATDVLARGIDVDQVDYVINYDIPEQAEDYVHRIGRTGRAGNDGFAVTFVTPENSSELRDIQKLIKSEIPEMQLEQFDMAQAEADAAEASITAQSKRDPEVNKVKRQLANKAQMKAEEASKRKIEREEAKHGKQKRTRTKKARANTQATAVEPAKRARRAASEASDTIEAPSRNRRASKQSDQVRSARPQRKHASKQQRPARTERSSKRAQGQDSKRDFRPGRAHRAEVERSRARSRKHR